MDGTEPRTILPKLPPLTRRVPGAGTWYFSWKDLTRHFGWAFDVDGLPAAVFTVDGDEVQTKQGRTIACMTSCTKLGVHLPKPFLTAMQEALDVRPGDVVDLVHEFTVSDGSMRGIMCIDARVQARRHASKSDRRASEQHQPTRPPVPTTYEQARTVAALEVATGARRVPTWLSNPPVKRKCHAGPAHRPS